MHLEDMLLDWYIAHAQSLRGVSYFIVMIFFILWGAWAVRHGLYHRAAIKLGTGLMLGSFVWSVVDRDPRIVLFITTPILIALSVIVVVFVFRIRIWSKA